MKFNKFMLFIVLYILVILLVLDFYAVSPGTLFIVFVSSYDFWLIDEISVFSGSFWDYIEASWAQIILEEKSLVERLVLELVECQDKIFRLQAEQFFSTLEHFKIMEELEKTKEALEKTKEALERAEVEVIAAKITRYAQLAAYVIEWIDEWFGGD